MGEKSSPIAAPTTAKKLFRLQVTAVAYDNPIPGFKTENTINLRLWAAKPDREFDLEAFNTGDYVQVKPSASVPPPPQYAPADLLLASASQKIA